MTTTQRRPRRVWRQVVVTVGAVLGSLCLTVAVLGMFFGIKPLVFTSGSMSPEITTGALAFARETPAQDLAVGDVVSVLDDRGQRVTHRVVSTEQSAGFTSLVLKGDANATADVRPYEVSTGDRVLVDIPAVGRAVTWLSSPDGLLAGGMFLGLVLFAAFSPSQGPRHRRASLRRSAVQGAFAVGVLGLCVQGSIQLAPTQAFWTESAGATSGSISALAAVPAPTGGSCVNDGTQVDGTWTAPTTNPARYRYRITAVRSDTNAQVGNPVYVTGTAADLVHTSFAPTTAFQATGQFNFKYVVTTAALNSMTWLSSSTVTIPFRFSQAYGATRCGNITSTSVGVTSLGSDTGTSQSDFITKTASNTVVGSSSTASGASTTVVLKRGATVVGTTTSDATTGAWSVPISGATFQEGAQTYTAEVTDYLGNTATTTQSATLDTVVPTVSQSAPCAAVSVGNSVSGVAGASWCKVTSLSMTATSADTGGSGVAVNEVNDANAGYATYSGAVSLAEANGRVVLVRATDVAGNQSTVDSKTYYIDGTAPTIAIASPSATTYSNAAALRSDVAAACGGSRVSCGKVTDAVSGASTTVVPRFQMRRDYQSCFIIFCSNQTDYMAANGSYGSSTATSPVTQSADGSYGIVVTQPSTTFYQTTASTYTLTLSGATDAAGNVAANVVRSFGNN